MEAFNPGDDPATDGRPLAEVDRMLQPSYRCAQLARQRAHTVVDVVSRRSVCRRVFLGSNVPVVSDDANENVDNVFVAAKRALDNLWDRQRNTDKLRQFNENTVESIDAYHNKPTRCVSMMRIHQRG